MEKEEEEAAEEEAGDADLGVVVLGESLSFLQAMPTQPSPIYPAIFRTWPSMGSRWHLTRKRKGWKKWGRMERPKWRKTKICGSSLRAQSSR
jgi:hypothetical protein